MRILIGGGDVFDSAEYSSRRALERMGHEVTSLDFRKAAAPGLLSRSMHLEVAWSMILRATVREDRGAIQTALLRRAREYRPDWIIVFPVNAILPETVEALKRATGARVSGWFQDHIVSFGRADFLAADFDVLCFKDKWIVDRLRMALSSSHIEYLPQCCDPNLHRPLPLTPAEVERYGCDVATYGNLYPYRALILEVLADLDLRIYGKLQGWENASMRARHQRFPVFGDEKCKAMAAAKIVVNTNYYAEIAAPNKRTFEVAGMGAFQLTDAPGLRQFFSDDEVVAYTGKDDLREKALYYLHRPKERQGFAERARARAHRDHTYDKRMESLIALTFGGKAGLSVGSSRSTL